MSRLWGTFSGFSLVARLIIGIVALLLVVGLLTRFSGAMHYLIFGDTAAKKAQAGTVVAESQGQAAKETGIEASNTVVRTYERHVEVDRIVKEGQSNVSKADRGQQMDPGIDAATAAGLCSVHDDLCRR